MTRKKLLQIIDRDKIKTAIQAAEHRTSGEICVSVAPFFWGSIEKAADRAFIRMGVARTKHRNGVLIFVVPSRRKFVVLGDSGAGHGEAHSGGAEQRPGDEHAHDGDT